MEEKLFKGLAHVAIYTDKYEEVMKFYTEVFPGEVMGDLYLEGEEDPSGFFPLKNGQVRLGDFFIEILETKDKRHYDNIPGYYNHIGIMVRDVDEAVEYLLAHGLSPDKVGTPGCGSRNPPPINKMKNCSVVGPCGELIGLYEKDNKIYEGKKFVCGKYVEYLKEHQGE